MLFKKVKAFEFLGQDVMKKEKSLFFPKFPLYCGWARVLRGFDRGVNDWATLMHFTATSDENLYIPP